MLLYKPPLRKIDKAKRERNSAKKGKLFEEATQEIFTTIQHIRVYDSNVLTEDGSQEVDIIFMQDLPTKLWFIGHAFFVECKCLNSKVPSKEVAFFGEKLIAAGISHGIIFSTKGLSGADRRAAHATVLRFKERGVHIISLTVAEVATLADASQLIELIIRKHMTLLTGQVV